MNSARTYKSRPIPSLAIIVALLSIISTFFCNAERIVTTRRHLTPVDTTCQRSDSTNYAPYTLTDNDSISQLLQLCGYGKSLGSSVETLFIENNSGSTLTEITLQVQYIDTDGRELHQRTVTQSINIPPRATRRIEFKSWDPQKSFYYIGGKTPRISAIPYDVRISPTSVTCHASH